MGYVLPSVEANTTHVPHGGDKALLCDVDHVGCLQSVLELNAQLARKGV